jgi:hypothetical protein
MATQNNVPAPAAPAAAPVATVTAAQPTALRNLPRSVAKVAALALGKPCYPRAPQTIAAYAAVQAAIAAGNNTPAGLLLVCQQANDPQWLGYAIKSGWLVAAK